MNSDISPIQQRNLEKVWQVKLIDRTHLILEIFADRAATREGRLQVDLATLSYQRTRLVRSWTHLERQRGGLGFIGGPGETQIESDRRAIDNAIVKIKSQLSKVVKTRSLHRKSRQKVPYPIVTLIGYTNAGKSTLLSVVSAAKPKIANYPFTTLVPNLGIVSYRGDKSFIMADIPGIIEGASEGKGLGLRFLRHIERNSALLFMVPADSDDIAKEYEILLGELQKYNPELLDKDRILAISKSDMLDEELIAEIKEELPTDLPSLFISSVAQQGITELKDLIWKKLNE